MSWWFMNWFNETAPFQTKSDTRNCTIQMSRWSMNWSTPQTKPASSTKWPLHTRRPLQRSVVHPNHRPIGLLKRETFRNYYNWDKFYIAPVRNKFFNLPKTNIKCCGETISKYTPMAQSRKNSANTITFQCDSLSSSGAFLITFHQNVNKMEPLDPNRAAHCSTGRRPGTLWDSVTIFSA